MSTIIRMRHLQRTYAAAMLQLSQLVPRCAARRASSKAGDVRHVARLAGLAISDNEVNTLQTDFARIISFVDKLDGVNTSGVAPMISPLEQLDAACVTHSDIVEERRLGDALRQGAPRTQGAFIVASGKPPRESSVEKFAE